MKNGEFFECDESLISFYQECYPRHNIQKHLLAMRSWAFSNESRRKTKRGMKRFINTWLKNTPEDFGKLKSTRDMTLQDELLNRDWAK